MKHSYILIPFLVLLVAVTSGFIINNGIFWYQSLLLPFWAPSVSLIGVLWGIAFILFAAAAVLAWEKSKAGNRNTLMALFGLVAFLTIHMFYLSFGLHELTAVFGEMLVLIAVTLALITMLWKKGMKESFYLLLPYILWIIFDTYLTYVIIITNY